MFAMYQNIIVNLNKHIIKSHIVCRNICFTKICKYNIASSVDKTLLNSYIQNLENEYNTFDNTDKLSHAHDKRFNKLSGVMKIVKERNKLTDLLVSINELLKESDEEMKKLVEEETTLYKSKLQETEEELIEALIPHNDEDLCDSIILEVNAGVGGQEAMLFAKEIFDMYWNFAEYKGWSCELTEYDTTDIGGLRHCSIVINGNEVYKFFKYEAGVHRVQRIPVTEKSGRVHTSTVSVVALPQPKDIDISVEEKDLRIDTKRASGAGGQHVNTTDSAVRIVHLPTGTTVECQTSRSQIKNRELAMQKLKALLYEQQLSEQIAKTEATRKSQVRSNFRNEKIRTYNFSQDRITDHRLQGTNFHNLKVFLMGGEPLETLINQLHSSVKYKQLMNILHSSNKNS